MGADAADSGSAMKPIHFGSAQPLSKHTGPSGPKKKYTTPAPGDYGVESKHNIRYKTSQTSRFGGTMCQVNRAATGLAADGIRKKDDPGPAHYSVVSAAQALNAKERSPTLKFGSSSRDDGTKAYIFRADTSGTGDPNKGNAGKGVPGPGAYGYGTITSIKPKSPSHSFGVRHASQEVSTTQKIGPGAYEHKSSLGKQAASVQPSSPIFGFGSAGRDQVNNVVSPGFSPIARTKTPAPGAYKQGTGVGRQAQSNYSSANAWSFGSDQRLKKGREVTTVPGPGRYSNNSMLGIQSSSRYQTSGGFKFGTSERAGLSEGLVG